MRNESDRLTDEQKRFLSYYDAIKGLGRQSDISGALAYATPEQKANINALRRLRGETELSEEELKQLGKGAESGKIKDVSSLIKSFEEEEKRSASYKSIEQDALNFDKMKRQDYYKNISSLTDFAYKLKRSADPNITQGGSSLLSAIEQLKSSSQREGGKVTATEAGLASVAPILLPIFASTGGKSVDNEKIYDANDAISRILGSLPDYIKKTGSVLKRGLRKK